jgi:alcohol dehydrogenase
MKQLTYIKKNILQWWDVEAPTLQSAQDAIVRPLAAARCDLEKAYLFNDYSRLMQLGVALHYLDPVTNDLLGKRPFAGPFAVGHECVAEVVSVGDAVKGFARGDKVIVPWAISCGSCLSCQTGLTSRCSDAGETFLSAFGFGPAMGPWGGMMSDVVRVPFAQQMLVRIPDGIDPIALASASDNIPDAWRTVGPLLKQRPGAPVLVVGGGAESIGLYAAAIAVAMDSTQVDYVDHHPARLEIAAALGANPIQVPRNKRAAWYRKNAPRRSGIYPIAVDAAANADALRFAIRSLAPGGVCTSVGILFQHSTSIPLLQMYANDSTLRTGISHPRADLPAVLELIRGGRFQPQKITTVLADWADAAEAWLERTTKVIVHRPALY